MILEWPCNFWKWKHGFLGALFEREITTAASVPRYLWPRTLEPALRRSENPAQNFVTNPVRLVARFNRAALRGSTGFPARKNRSVEAMASFPSGIPNFVFAFLRLQSRFKFEVLIRRGLLLNQSRVVAAGVESVMRTFPNHSR